MKEKKQFRKSLNFREKKNEINDKVNPGHLPCHVNNHARTKAEITLLRSSDAHLISFFLLNLELPSIC